jgi:lipopolysaccharide export system protein LptA
MEVRQDQMEVRQDQMEVRQDQMEVRQDQMEGSRRGREEIKDSEMQEVKPTASHLQVPSKQSDAVTR